MTEAVTDAMTALQSVNPLPISNYQLLNIKWVSTSNRFGIATEFQPEGESERIRSTHVWRRASFKANRKAEKQ